MSSVRITGGTLRGRRIAVPKSDVRPTSERARQAFFNIVGERIEGARFLDLFAGSAIFSFEALSRGAREAVAVDISRPQMAAVERTARDLGVNLRTIGADVMNAIRRTGSEPFDVVYADPPYAWDHYDELLLSLDANLPLADGAILAIEHRRRTEPFQSEPRRIRFARRAEYGEVWITFFIA